MKKFWGKYKVLILVVVGILAFIGLSIFTEKASKSKTTEALENITVLTESIPNDKSAVVVIGLTYCSHCHNFNPVITKIAKDYNLPLYWFDYDALSDEDAEALVTAFEEHGYTGSSPYIAVFKDGEVVSTHVGEMGNDSTITFLKEAGVIK